MVLGEEESVLISEVSLFQGLKSTQTWYLGRKNVSCLERCPYFRGVLIEVFHCIMKVHVCVCASIMHVLLAGIVVSLQTAKM